MEKGIKIVAVISSANFNGNGAMFAREALRGAMAEGAQVEEILLYKHKLQFCTGCFKCMSEGKCPINDDFEDIKRLLYDADGIILCSPTFGAYMNANMKNLIDRLGMYERCTSMLGGKYVVGISTAGAAGTARKVAKSMADMFSIGVFKRGYTTGIMGASYMPDGVHKKADILKKSYELGKSLVGDIKAGKQYILQNLSLRLISKLVLRPIFSQFILKGKEGNTKAVYENLRQRELLP